MSLLVARKLIELHGGKIWIEPAYITKAFFLFPVSLFYRGCGSPVVGVDER